MAVPKVEVEYLGITSGLELYEPPSSAFLAQTTFVSITTIEFDPALFYDFKPLQEHLDRLCVLADLVRAAHQTVDQHEARIQAELKELWDDNTNLRKRGLRGGTARKQRKVVGNYVKFSTHAAIGGDLLEHRLEVEKTDYFGRNRIAGLRALRVMFEEAFNYIRQEQYKCEDVLTCADALNYGAITQLIIDKIASVDEVVFGKELEKIEDIEEMLEAFHEEYDKSL